jgi:hypothetical protein
MEIIRRAHEQKPSADGIRRSRWVVVRNCYDDQTEILTEKRGWRLFRDLLPDDKVATLDGDTLVYELPESVVAKEYSGEMLGYEGEGANFLVTPDHKMWVSIRRTRKKIWGEYEILEAKEVYGSQTVRVRRDAIPCGGNQEYPLDFYEFYGFWLAEGSCGEYLYPPRKTPSRRLNVTQKTQILYVESLLERNGFEYRKNSKTDSPDCYVYSLEKNKSLMTTLWHLFSEKSPAKYIPQNIKDAPANCLKALLHGYFMGDGGESGGTVRLRTSSKRLADDFQEIALKAGLVANIAVEDTTGKRVLINGHSGVINYPSYKITFLKELKHRPILHVDKKNTNHLKGWYRQDYNGMVYCVEMPPVPVYVRRGGKAFWCLRSYRQLLDTTIKTFHDWFPPRIFGEWRVTDHSYFITKFPGVQLEVLFRALDRPDQVSNLLSLEVTGAWFNEVREIPKTIIEAMDARIGRYPSARDGGPSWLGIIMDTNPPDEDSYLYKMFEKLRPEGWRIFKQPSGLSVHAENTKHLPRNYYKNLARGKDEMYIRIYIHGQYGYLVSGKPVFASYRDNIHVAPHALELMKGIPIISGWDFGLQPTVVFGQISPVGQLRILDELVSDGMGLRQFCENQVLPLLRQKYFGYNVMVYGDPSGISRSPTDESTCFDILHSAEIGLSNIISAPTNAIVPRVGAVEQFLNKMSYGEPGFILSPEVHWLRKAMNGAYHYDKDPKGSGEEYKPIPVKNFASHVSDALQYLCLYVSEAESYDKQKKAFLAQLKQKEYRPASSLAAY